jgi:hypothetical protein
MGRLSGVITLSLYVATACGGMSLSAGCRTAGEITPIWARSPSRFASRTAMGHSRNRARGYGDWLQRRRVRPRMTPWRRSSLTSALQIAAAVLHHFELTKLAPDVWCDDVPPCRTTGNIASPSAR